MKAGNSDFDVDTLIEVIDVASDDPDDAVGVVGTVGKLTHPFGDLPSSVLGVWVETRGNTPPGTTFPMNRIGLCPGDRFQVIETGKVEVV